MNQSMHQSMNQSMNEVMNNNDVCRLIYSFGYPKHRIYMKSIVNYFKKKQKSITFNMDCIYDDWSLYIDRYYHSGFNIFLCDIFNQEQQKILLIQFINCKCCTRHSNSKPIILNNVITYTPTTQKYYKDPYCKCTCRHISRKLWICCKNYIPLYRLKGSPYYRSIVEINYKNIVSNISNCSSVNLD